MELDPVETRLGLTFSDKTLLERALTHRSYFNENPTHPLEDNERLEFLGDAVLDFIVGELLYHRFPEMPEGQLTSLRSAVVRTDTLAQFAREIELGQCLQMGKGEEDAGGRDRTAILCGTFEALAGALYLDQGLPQTESFLVPLIVPFVENILHDGGHKDAKSLLQELAQGERKLTPTYRTTAEDGPDHAKRFTVEAVLNGVAYGRGVGPNKQQAAQTAAKMALERLRAELGLERHPGQDPPNQA
jgi:ribonuclease III